MNRRQSERNATKDSASAEVEAFNDRYPVGTKGLLRKDSGDVVETAIRHEAYVSESGQPIAFFTDISGYYLIDRFTATFE